MEFTLHWGWDEMEWGVEGCKLSDGTELPSPAGEYRTEEVKGYLGEVFDWLEANAEEEQIEKWFTFITYADITTCNEDAYAGLTLFEKPWRGSDLSEVGEFFRQRVLDYAPE